MADGGLPQLDPSSYASQLFWLVVTFAITYVAMAKFVVPNIREVLERRRNQIQHDLDTAERAQRDAESAKNAYMQAMHEAKENSKKQIAEAQKEVDRLISAEQAKVAAELDAKMAESATRIAEQRKQAYASIAPMLTDIVSDITKRMTGKEPDSAMVAEKIALKLKEHQA